jgi:hypothetical protein
VVKLLLPGGKDAEAATDTPEATVGNYLATVDAMLAKIEGRVGCTTASSPNGSAANAAALPKLPQ